MHLIFTSATLPLERCMVVALKGASSLCPTGGTDFVTPNENGKVALVLLTIMMHYSAASNAKAPNCLCQSTSTYVAATVGDDLSLLMKRCSRFGGFSRLLSAVALGCGGVTWMRSAVTFDPVVPSSYCTFALPCMLVDNTCQTHTSCNGSSMICTKSKRQTHPCLKPPRIIKHHHSRLLCVPLKPLLSRCR